MSKIKNIFANLLPTRSSVLGVAKGTRRYDLPLTKGSGNVFLRALIALMTFLAMMGLSANFALSEMTERWSSGLENKATIEIPAEGEDGKILNQEAVNALTQEAYNFLKSHPAVDTIEIMDDQKISDLVAPWLGESFNDTLSGGDGAIPLPGIITVGFKKKIAFDVQSLQENLARISTQIKLDTHESWLRDVLRFTGALNFAALLITVIIGITTVVAVAGSVQSRMAIYHEELELLHLMGASDSYISRQLQRYIFIIALQGAVIGALAGGFVLGVIGLIAGELDIALLPNFTLSGLQLGLLLLLPLFIGFLGMVTARHTVLHVLSQMP